MKEAREGAYQKSMIDPVVFESDKEDTKSDNDDGHKEKGNGDEGDGKSSSENEKEDEGDGKSSSEDEEEDEGEEDGDDKYEDSESEDNGEMGAERLRKSHDAPTRNLCRRKPSFNLRTSSPIQSYLEEDRRVDQLPFTNNELPY